VWVYVKRLEEKTWLAIVVCWVIKTVRLRWFTIQTLMNGKMKKIAEHCDATPVA